MSLLPALADSSMTIGDVTMGVNYGLNRVRFTAPVPVGSRIRGRFVLKAYEAIDGGAQLTMTVTMACEGAERPACVAESVSRRFTGTAP